MQEKFELSQGARKRILLGAVVLIAALLLGSGLMLSTGVRLFAAPSAQDATPVPAEQPTDQPANLPAPTPTFEPVPTPVQLTEEQILNAAVIVPSIDPAGSLQLVNGAFKNDQTGVSVQVSPNVPIVMGDLTGDGAADAAVVLDVTLLDGELATDLVVITNQAGAPVALSATRLGSPAHVEELRIDRGAIWLEMLTAGPLDDPCCPSIPLQRVLIPAGAELMDMPAIATGTLFPYKVGEKWGYVNTLGEFVVPPQFQYAGEYSEGVALVSFDAGRFGFIDLFGRVVIPMRYSFASAFDGGITVAGVPAVSADQADSVVYLDRAGNNVLGEGVTFSAGLPFREGMAAVRSPEGKYGYINLRGSVVITPTYDFALGFSEGLAPVLVVDKVGYVDRKGGIAIEPAYDAGDLFSEGLAAVAQGGKVGYIDQRGAFAIPPAYDRAGKFVSGLAPVELNGVEFYVDITGNAVITAPLFIDAQEFSEGLAAVRVDGKVGYVDTQGTMVVAPQYTTGSAFRGGFATVETDLTWSVISYNGAVVVQLAKPVELKIADTVVSTSTTPAASEASTSTSVAPLETETIFFSAEVPDEIRVGACVSGSEIVAATNAFRCSAENVVYDPCFVAAGGTSVICGVDPALGAAGFDLQLTQPLPEVTLEGRAFPGAWLFQIQNGAICRYNQTGASITVDGQRLNFVCSDLTQLYGDIDKTQTPWSINIVTTRDDGAGNYSVDTLTPTNVIRVWMPQPVQVVAVTPVPQEAPAEGQPPAQPESPIATPVP